MLWEKRCSVAGDKKDKELRREPIGGGDEDRDAEKHE